MTALFAAVHGSTRPSAGVCLEGVVGPVFQGRFDLEMRERVHVCHRFKFRVDAEFVNFRSKPFDVERFEARGRRFAKIVHGG